MLPGRQGSSERPKLKYLSLVMVGRESALVYRAGVQGMPDAGLWRSRPKVFSSISALFLDVRCEPLGDPCTIQGNLHTAPQYDKKCANINQGLDLF